MNPSILLNIDAEEARFIAGTALTGSYQNLGAVTSNPAKALMIKNSTDKTVIVSWDSGTTGNFRLPANTVDTISEPNFARQKGVQFMAKHAGVAATTGEVIVQVLYKP